jgi:hypothetical protein
MCDALITKKVHCCCLQVYGPDDAAALRSLILSKAGPAGDFGGRCGTPTPHLPCHLRA